MPYGQLLMYGDMVLLSLAIVDGHWCVSNLDSLETFGVKVVTVYKPAVSETFHFIYIACIQFISALLVVQNHTSK